MKAARYVVFIGTGLGFVMGAGLIHFVDDAAMTSKDATIQYQSEQLSDYRSALQGAQPDQAAKEVAGLRGQIDYLNARLTGTTPPARYLTDDQKQKLTKGFSESDQKFDKIIIVSGGGDSPDYAVDFETFFKGIGIESPIIPFSCERDQRGLMVGLQNLASPSPRAAAFIKILKDAGLNVSRIGSGLLMDPNLDFDLFICTEQ